MTGAPYAPLAHPRRRPSLAIHFDQFRRELIYRTRAPGSQVLADLVILRDMDAEKKRQAASTGQVAGIALGSSVAALFLTGMFWELMPSVGQALLLITVLLFVTSIVAFFVRVEHVLNLENRRYTLVSRLLELLRVDMAPTEPLALELDLRPDTHSAKFRGEGETPNGWKVRHYLDPWLSLRGRLLDGTHFHVEMIERVAERSRWKKNSRGKSKHKRKKASDAIAKVQLRVKPERYPHLGRLGPRAGEAVQLPPGTRLKHLDVEADRLTLTVVLVDSPWSPNDTDAAPVNAVRVMAMMFLSLYQLLNLSRALDKKAAHSSVG